MRRGAVVLYACYDMVWESSRFISRRDICSGAWSALVGLLESALVGFVQSSEAVSLSAWSALVRLVESRAFCASQALVSCVHACMPQQVAYASCTPWPRLRGKARGAQT